MNTNASNIKIVNTAAELTRRVLEACAAFGLGVRHRAAPTIHRRLPAGIARTLQAICPGEHIFVSGDSGAGKSTLLGRMAEHLHAQGNAVYRLDFGYLREHGSSAVIEALDGPIDMVIATLSRAGLAEGPLLVRPIRELSEGQKWRLALAIAMQRAASQPRQRAWIVVDECAATLDVLTARCTCAAAGAWCARAGISIIAAASRSAPAAWINASCRIRVCHTDAGHRFTIHHRA
jgi:hypothetical protein